MGNKLVAYCDVLGTKDEIENGNFGDWDLGSFLRPVMREATKFPDVHFSGVSDCLFIVTDETNSRSFVEVMANLYESWYRNVLWVRSGISCGQANSPRLGDEVPCVHTPNLSLLPLWGQAVVDAATTESKMTGALPFIHESAQGVECIESNSISVNEVKSLKVLSKSSAKGLHDFTVALLGARKNGRNNGIGRKFSLRSDKHLIMTRDMMERQLDGV